MLENAVRDIANWRTKRETSLYKVSSVCLDDHHFKKEELESVGELSKVCSQIVLKWWYLGRIGGPDFFWVSDKFAPSVTKTDSGLRLLFILSHTSLAQDLSLVISSP